MNISYRQIIRSLHAVRGLGGLFTVALALAASSVVADDKTHSSHSQHDASHSMTAHLKSLSGEAFEAEFLNTMTQHHQDAIKMGQLVQTRSSDANLKKLAQQMVEKQSAQVQQMTELLRTAYNKRFEPMSHDDPAMKRMMNKMSELQSLKGSSFDQKFVTTTVQHHKEGIEMAKLALDRAQDDRVRQLAEEILKDQKKEIPQLQRIAHEAK